MLPEHCRLCFLLTSGFWASPVEMTGQLQPWFQWIWGRFCSGIEINLRASSFKARVFWDQNLYLGQLPLFILGYFGAKWMATFFKERKTSQDRLRFGNEHWSGMKVTGILQMTPVQQLFGAVCNGRELVEFQLLMGASFFRSEILSNTELVLQSLMLAKLTLGSNIIGFHAPIYCNKDYQCK